MRKLPREAIAECSGPTEELAENQEWMANCGEDHPSAAKAVTGIVGLVGTAKAVQTKQRVFPQP